MRAHLSLLGLLAMAAFSWPVLAEDAETEKAVESPSPDGRFAFLATHRPEQRTFDLIEKDSGKVLLRVAESDEGSDELTVNVLWAADSSRFAATEAFHNRRMNDIAVYLREGTTFRAIELPDLPEATLPDELGSDRDHFWHVNVMDWKTPQRWRKDGSLVVEMETTLDGNDNFATATRTVVLGFDRTGTAKVLKSTQKVTSHIEPGD